MTSATDLQLSRDGHVARITLARPPQNFVDTPTIEQLVAMLLALDEDDTCRAVLLESGVDVFCAGADFSAAPSGGGAPGDPAVFYGHAMKLFRTRKPIVAAVAGAAVGAGLGLALAADFRVSCAEARFSANFNRLGIHPGFGMSVTLPRVVGEQRAAELFFTGQRLTGKEALDIGLIDHLVPKAEVSARALAQAQEIALSAPLAVETTRATLRRGLAEQVAEVNQRELEIQRGQFRSEDFREGVAAMSARRAPVFQRR
ncbi:enoyl-CoA hydratase/isomerase family protein [Cupriavidus necator]|uniref:enoyl-CoA hydratase/isomerase family protein n=1 Tax=Cupriavidus necator TaxID=106590 RepID=UPI003ECE70D5